jgi:hypothetical protein
MSLSEERIVLHGTNLQRQAPRSTPEETLLLHQFINRLRERVNTAAVGVACREDGSATACVAVANERDQADARKEAERMGLNEAFVEFVIDARIKPAGFLLPPYAEWLNVVSDPRELVEQEVHRCLCNAVVQDWPSGPCVSVHESQLDAAREVVRRVNAVVGARGIHYDISCVSLVGFAESSKQEQPTMQPSAILVARETRAHFALCVGNARASSQPSSLAWSQIPDDESCTFLAAKRGVSKLQFCGGRADVSLFQLSSSEDTKYDTKDDTRVDTKVECAEQAILCATTPHRISRRIVQIVCLPPFAAYSGRVHVVAVDSTTELDVVGHEYSRHFEGGTQFEVVLYLAHFVGVEQAKTTAHTSLAGLPVFTADGVLHSFFKSCVHDKVERCLDGGLNKGLDGSLNSSASRCYATLVPAHFALEKAREILDIETCVVQTKNPPRFKF